MGLLRALGHPFMYYWYHHAYTKNDIGFFVMIQVQIGAHSFTFDNVYGNGGSPSSSMFEECVAPLVDGLFQGYNATVLAYGQVISVV